MDALLEDQIWECFGRVVYTHKTHEKMADLCAGTLRRFKIAQIVLSALATCGVVSLFLTDELLAKIITALFSFANLVVAGYMKGFDPGGYRPEASRRRRTALERARVLSISADRSCSRSIVGHRRDSSS